MANHSYRKRGLVLKRGGAAANDRQIRELQADLRCLGYLKKGIDGFFGKDTESAVMSLRYDLLHNDGRSRQGDGSAPVRVLDFNRGRVFQVTGDVDETLAGCISDMVDDPVFPTLPNAKDPKRENEKILTTLRGITTSEVPIPILLGILRQESGLTHFNVPGRNDEDTYIAVGFDRNATERFIITSRGYGAGQYTLFHHPPTKEEVEEFMLDVERNLGKAIRELRGKFDSFVNGSTTGTRADDRRAEIGSGPLRICKYKEGDPRFLKGCKQCMADAGQIDIKEGITPIYKGSKHTFLPTRYYREASHGSVPVRKNVGCDWPYAVRRYNGAGIDSYHYQAIVLHNVLTM
jgi:hypothetical protein